MERKAEESGNFASVIGAVQLMNWMMALGAGQTWSRGHRHNGDYYRRWLLLGVLFYEPFPEVELAELLDVRMLSAAPVALEGDSGW